MMNLDSLDPRIAALLGSAGTNPLLAQASPPPMPGGGRVNMTPPANSWNGDQFRVGAFPPPSAAAGPPTGVAPPAPPPMVQPGPQVGPAGGNPLLPGMMPQAGMMGAGGLEEMRSPRSIGGNRNPFLKQKF